MLFRNRMVLPLLCGAVVLGACSDTPAPTAASSEPAVAAPDAASASASELAGILAAGMARADVREAVRDAMRQSPYAEHKLVLQEWTATADGERAVQAIASAAGVPADRLSTLMERLPRMDLYLPFREHRTSWAATADVVVAVTLDQNRLDVTGVHTDGRTRTFRRSDGVPASAMLMLHPAEAKNLRVDRRPSRPGSVVEDVNAAGPVAASVTPFQPGDEEVCDPYDLTCGGGPTSPTTGTYLEGFWYTFEADTEWGGEEVEFRTQLKDNACGGCVVAGKTLRFEGVDDGGSAQYYDKFTRLYTQRVSSTQWISMSVYETDVGSDDYFGTRLFYHSDFAAGVISGQATKEFTKAVSCGYPASLCESIYVTADVRVTPWP